MVIIIVIDLIFCNQMKWSFLAFIWHLTNLFCFIILLNRKFHFLSIELFNKFMFTQTSIIYTIIVYLAGVRYYLFILQTCVSFWGVFCWIYSTASSNDHCYFCHCNTRRKALFQENKQVRTMDKSANDYGEIC